MSEWIGIAVSIVGAIVAVVGWIKSATNAKKAKADAELAANYAKNADEANQSAKRYYDKMQEHLENQSEQIEKKKIKEKILIAMEHGRRMDISEIAQKVGITVEQVDELLKELSADGYKINKASMYNELKDQRRAWTR